MAYVIQRKKDSMFLAKEESIYSYTFKLVHIRFFETKEEAEKEKLQDERIIPIFNL